ncbi:MAG: carboxypeptidase-like regulatory domain-containing protein [Flavobacteriaceae bacterium]
MNFKNSIKFILLFISIFSFSQSQNKVTGLISDTTNQGIAYVNVLLIKASDSTLTKGTITSEKGAYTIDNIACGNYMIMSSYVGYKTAYSKPFYLDSDYIVAPITLIEGELQYI